MKATTTKKLLDLQKLINKVVPKTVADPKFYSIAEEEMNNVVWTPIEAELSADKIAFAMRTPGGIYKVFVNNKIPEQFRDYFRLHEFGHVLFGHLKDIELQQAQFNKRVVAVWDEFKKYIRISKDDENLSKTELVNKYAIPLAGLITNYATDMEVNSKMFTAKEWKLMRNITDWTTIAAGAQEEDVSPTWLDKATEFLEKDYQSKGKHFSKPVWPEDYGFEVQKSFQEYLDLILHNLDAFMEYLQDDVDEMKNSQGIPIPAPDGQSDGQNGQSSKDGEGISAQDLKKLSLDDIEKLRNAVSSDTSKEANEKAAEEAEKASTAKSGDKGEDDNNHEKGLGFDHRSSSKSNDVISLKNARELARFLEEEAFSKKVENYRNNAMYYYNRRKYGDTMLISKMTKEDVYRPGNLYIIVDCSGSISTVAVERILGCLRILSKRCGPKSRVIWWDTSLCGDVPLRGRIEPHRGGGTDIGSGIEYVKEKYLRSSNDKLVIVSDYEDSLGKWYNVAKSIKNDIIGLLWSDRPNLSRTGLKNYIEMCNYGRDFNSKDFLKKFKTKVIDISQA